MAAKLTNGDITLLLEILNERRNWIDGEPFSLAGAAKARNDAMKAKLLAMRADIDDYNKKADADANAALAEVGIDVKAIEAAGGCTEIIHDTVMGDAAPDRTVDGSELIPKDMGGLPLPAAPDDGEVGVDWDEAHFDTLD